LIQTIGRAARNINGTAILYADKMTDSMKAAIGETERRRTKQVAHNLAMGITPRSVSTRIRDMIDGAVSDKSAKDDLKAAKAAAEVEAMSEKDLGKRIKLLEKQMLEHARNLEFEKAARTRDQLALLREQAFGAPGHDLNVVPLLARLLQGKPEDPSDVIKVLMVCTANVCRSPTAEAVLRAKLQRAHLHKQVLVDSAGTQGFQRADPPDPRAQRAAALRGYDLSTLRARTMDEGDFSRFQHIVAMDSTHLAWLHKRAPDETQAHLQLLMDHARQHPGLHEVPDPYYGGPAGFERVLDLIEDACDGLVAKLQEQLAQGALLPRR
jgi:protein-tyrosine-phosphatase